jgi:hypothetical protein
VTSETIHPGDDSTPRAGSGGAGALSVSTLRRLLDPTYAAKGRLNYKPIPAFLQKLSRAENPCRVGILGDSTANGTNEWFYTWAQWLAAQYPGRTVLHQLWNDTTQQYDLPTVIQTGTDGRRKFSNNSDAANWLTVADSAATSPTGDIDVRLKLTLGDWTPAATTPLCGKVGGATDRGWWLELNTTGALTLQWSNDGSTTGLGAASSVGVPFADGTTGWVRATLDVDNGASGRDTKYYTSTDGVTWTQLGITRTSAGATTVFDSTVATQFVGRSGGGLSIQADLYEAIVMSGIDGARVIHIVADAIPSIGSTFTDLVGNTVTIAGSTATRSGALALTLFNASVSGQAIAYANDGTRFPKLTPVQQDLTFISFSHNEGSTLAYRTPYKTLTDALIAKWPDVGIISVLQNPRTAPTGNIIEHAVRGEQIRALSGSQRFDVVDAYEAFMTDPRGLGVLVSGDGIHPTQVGFDLWRDTAKAPFAAWM